MTTPGGDADVVIIGAGIAGLAAALHLSDAGRDVILLEGADGVGGRASTEVVDGWRLDRGFQVHDTSYPTMASLLDADALRLREFTHGAVVHRGGRGHRVVDPRRQPRDLLATATAPIGSLRDKAASGLLASTIAASSVARLLARPETTTYEALRAAHISDACIDTFWRPFLAGVFLEDRLSTSSRFFSLVLRSQVRGIQCLPAEGIGALADQLAARLPTGVLRLGTPVETVSGGSGPSGALIRTGGAQLSARAVVVATDPATAHRLLPQLGPAPARNDCATAYFSAPGFDPEPIIHLEADGGGGPIVNAVVLPSEQPGTLLSVTSLDADVTIEHLLAQLRRWHGSNVERLEHIATYRLPGATVDMPVPQGVLRRTVDLGGGVLVCGDHRDSASTQGAAVSGRRAARAVLAELSGRQAA